MQQGSGLVFNIQRYAIHDGGGVRTLVFMKGCPLRCPWCANPEGRHNYPEIAILENRCADAAICGARCVAACPERAVAISSDGKPVIDRDACRRNAQCCTACYYGALQVVGREMTLAQVLAEVEKDLPFYRRSGGGVTVGGGEPLLQAPFVIRLLEACRERYLNTAIETTAFGSRRHLRTLLRHVDLAYVDLKHMDSATHEWLTGVPNEPILENLRAVFSGQRACEIILRVTAVPGVNDSEANIAATARFARELGCEQMELLPYHRLGASKYRQYGMAYGLGQLEPPSAERMHQLRRLVESFGVREMTGVL